MIGVIDVGGGLRGSYGAGVLDYCIDNHIEFDYGLGVSAGSANVASYLGHQKGRNYTFYVDYAQRKEYMGLSNLLHTKSYIGLDYVYSTLSNSDGENPLNYQGIMDNKAEFKVVGTNALTGKAYYFDKSDMSLDNYYPLKASCNIPILDREYFVGDIPYYDGGIADPIPYKKAFADGCDKLVIILTLPKNEKCDEHANDRFAKILRHRYPNAAEAFANRNHLYNECLDEIIKLEKENKVCIISPDNIGKMKTLNRRKEDIIRLYDCGYEDAKKIKEFVK